MSSKGQLWWVISEVQQATFPTGCGRGYQIYGTITGGSSAAGYDVTFDTFPADAKIATGVTAKRLTVVVQGPEEPTESARDRKKRLKVEAAEAAAAAGESFDLDFSEDEDGFNDLTQDELKTLSKLTLRTTEHPGADGDDEGRKKQEVVWTIQADGVHVQVGPDIPPPEIDTDLLGIDFARPISEVFFNKLLPDVTGHAQLMDEYLNDKRASYHCTYKTRKMRMVATNDGPDYRIKRCYLLMIAAATELENGIENLWKSGSSGGRHNYPDFGQYEDKVFFQVFASVAPYAFCDKKHWFKHRDEKPWDIFKAAMDSYNGRRAALFEGVLTCLMIDESSYKLKPKTSKFGGAPNLIHEPRKPVDFGAQTKNGAECASGVILFQDVVEGVEVQRKKKFYGEQSSPPCGKAIDAGTAETLRQVDGAKVPKGGWVGGDAWFGSLMTAVETRVRLGACATLIIKGHFYLFPRKQLEAIMTARHGRHCAGKWVTMTATVAGVELLGICCAWSVKGWSYIVTTAGSSSPAASPYVSKYENEFGQVNVKEIPRPQCADFYYKYCWQIDEHNRQRQGALDIESCFPTSHCWFRFICSLVGQSVVDLFKLYKAHDPTTYEGMGVLAFADRVVGPLPEKESRRRAHDGVADPASARPALALVSTPTRKAPGQKRVLGGTLVGSTKQGACWVCRMHHGTTYSFTSKRCPKCSTLICEVDRSAMGVGSPGRYACRQHSCYWEHLNSDDPRVKCNGSERKGKFPKG